MIEKGRVLCIGDSLTAGWVSAHWVSQLNAKHNAKGVTFINAGVSGNTARSVMLRLPALLQKYKQPAAVVVLCGTNDVLSTISGAVALSEALLNGSWRHVNIEEFTGSVLGALSLLTQHCPASTVAILSIPPIGENVNSELNATVRVYNKQLEQLVQGKANIYFVDLYQSFAEQIALRSQPSPYVFTDWQMAWTAIKCLWRKIVLQQDWDVIACAEGNVLYTDHIHFASTAGKLVQDKVEEFLLAHEIL